MLEIYSLQIFPCNYYYYDNYHYIIINTTTTVITTVIMVNITVINKDQEKVAHQSRPCLPCRYANSSQSPAPGMTQPADSTYSTTIPISSMPLYIYGNNTTCGQYIQYHYTSL